MKTELSKIREKLSSFQHYPMSLIVNSEIDKIVLRFHKAGYSFAGEESFYQFKLYLFEFCYRLLFDVTGFKLPPKNKIHLSRNKFLGDFPHLKSERKIKKLVSQILTPETNRMLLATKVTIIDTTNKKRNLLKTTDPSFIRYKEVIELNKQGMSTYRACQKIARHNKINFHNFFEAFNSWTKANNIQTISHSRKHK